MTTTPITVASRVEAPLARTWEGWTSPEHVVHWNHASDDWHCPHARNDLRPGGTFAYHMAARDGSVGFDFEGTYDEVELHARIAYTMPDGRKVSVRFEADGDGATRVTETFDPEQVHSVELQQSGWQAILDNFKRYVEGLSGRKS